MRYYKIIVGEGMGCLMSPPGHASLNHSVDEFSSARGRVPIGSYALDYLIDPDADASPGLVDRARRLLRRPLAPVPSEMWIRSVYGYFRNTWVREVPTDASRWMLRGYGAMASDAPARWQERSAAVQCIREFYPSHEPRDDLLRDPSGGYGSWPCKHCGARVQYEARADAFCVVGITYETSVPVWSRNPTCDDSPDRHHHPATEASE